MPEEGEETGEDWAESDAKEYLYGLLCDKKIPEHLKPKQVYEQFCKGRSEFEDFPRDRNWPSRLKRLRDKASTRSTRAAIDAACLAHDRLIFPEPVLDLIHGCKVWQGSEAQKLLCQDIQNGKHPAMKPKDLFETRAEYYLDYTLDFFREKIYQEKKAFKHKEYIKDKEEKKAKEAEDKKKKKKKKKNKQT
jgi:hypothetical protein